MDPTATPYLSAFEQLKAQRDSILEKRDALAQKVVTLNEVNKLHHAVQASRNPLTLVANGFIAAYKKIAGTPIAETPSLQTAFEDAVSAWEIFSNLLERIAGDALAIDAICPGVARNVIGGQISELARNLIDTARILSGVRPGTLRHPMDVVKDQPRAFENIQRALSAWFSEDVDALMELFRRADFPTVGFDSAHRKPGDAASPSAPVIGGPTPISILHISDLHRTKDEKVGNPEVLSDLLHALKTIDGIESVDLIVASGDLTQTASVAEYNEANEFFTKLCDALLGGDRTRLIVVPGNHDIDWQAGKTARFVLSEKTDDGTPTHGRVELAKTGRVALPDGNAHDLFSANMRAFYKSLFGRNYPNVLKEQFEVFEFPTLGVACLGISTCAGMHHCSDSVSVDREALIAGLDRLAACDPSFLRIVVGHHGPVRELHQHDAVAMWVFDRMSAKQVSLYFHGHVHESSCTSLAQSSDSRIFAVGVGSLVAGPRQRPEAAPRQYHLVRVDVLSRVSTVHVRRKDKRDDPWKPDFRFNSPTTPRDQFRLVL